jgi:hypothetical protein
MEPRNWTFDRDLHAQVDPTEHPELVEAIERLWDSEVGRNCQVAALTMGVIPALKMAMGGAVTYVLVNEDFSRWKTSHPRKRQPGIEIAGLDDISKVARAMEGLRERRDHRPHRPPR